MLCKGKQLLKNIYNISKGSFNFKFRPVMAQNNNSDGIRGSFIVVEGIDRSGKTTQSKKLFDALTNEGVRVKYINFPVRSSPTGHLIDDFLQKRKKVDDNALHLIFAANRWEQMTEIKNDLENGINIIADRYSYSGVAYSAAKKGLDFDWCRQVETGLLKPDAIIFLSVSPDVAARRGGYGDEAYDSQKFQKKVADVYEKLKEPSWKVFDADQSVDNLHQQLLEFVRQQVETDPGSFKLLW